MECLPEGQFLQRSKLLAEVGMKVLIVYLPTGHGMQRVTLLAPSAENTFAEGATWPDGHTEHKFGVIVMSQNSPAMQPS